MRYKGQVELIIVVAILVVISVVVVSQMNLMIAPAESPDVRAVRESVENMIRSAALDTIATMSDNGGYLSPSDYQLDSVILNGKEVPFWQHSGSIAIPDKAANLQSGVQSYLDANKDSLLEILSGVTLGNPVVGVPVFADDGITLTVTMPTTYNDAPVAQPYTVTVATHFGEIYEFSEGFARYEARERPLEYYTLSSMVLSPMENGHRSIPIYEILVECGDYLFATSWDIMPKVEATIRKTLANTYMPGKAPLNTIRVSSSPKYSLVPINSKEYQDLDVNFMLPDDFSLSPLNFRMVPDVLSGIAEVIPMAGGCMSREPISAMYSIEYPAIVRVLDPETNNVFQYAVLVSIVNNLPSAWNFADEAEDLQKEVCSFPSCFLDIEVQDSSGDPVGSATVKYMDCYLGDTYSDGRISVPAPCGIGPLYIQKRGYGEYLESRDSGNLVGTVTLYRLPQINVMLHEVIIQDFGGERYMVYFGDVLTIDGKRVQVSLRSDQNFKEHSFFSSDSSFTASTIPPGGYIVTGSLMSPDLATLEGAVVYSYTITEDTDTLHIYIPTNIGLSSIGNQTEQTLKIGKYSEVLESCGIGPVTEVAYNQEEACEVILSE
jgi:hypothetical protein